MRKKQKKKLFKIILFIILAILIILGFKYLKKDEAIELNKQEEPVQEPVQEPKTYLNNITYQETVDEEIAKVIIEYMDTYYKSMKELKEYDLTYLFSNPTSDQAYVNQTAISLLVEIRKLKPTDLTLSSVKYDLEITDVEISDEQIKVTVLEDNYLHFNFMKEIESKVYNIENEFVFEKINDEYKIVSYDKVQDFFVMVTDKYNSGGKTALDTIKNDYLTTIKKNVENDQKDYQDFLNNTGITRKTCDHNYDRQSASNYAKAWVNKRNNDWLTFGSNCQNFVSQMIYTGGVPMDYSGDYSLQWKLYSGSYNTSQTASGYVYSWTYVPSFREYAKNNTGYGMCADVDVNMYYAEAGDVIHVGTTGPTRHALAVIGTYEKDDKVVDILVNSNTVDLENYPMSAYVYPYTSLIKIYGWNE